MEQPIPIRADLAAPSRNEREALVNGAPPTPAAPAYGQRGTPFGPRASLQPWCARTWRRVASLALVAGLAAGAHDPVAAPRVAAAPTAALTPAAGQYRCPVHPQVHKRTPGKCPLCGATLQLP
jgi:hypothetical protein